MHTTPVPTSGLTLFTAVACQARVATALVTVMQIMAGLWDGDAEPKAGTAASGTTVASDGNRIASLPADFKPGFGTRFWGKGFDSNPLSPLFLGA